MFIDVKMIKTIQNLRFLWMRMTIHSYLGCFWGMTIQLCQLFLVAPVVGSEKYRWVNWPVSTDSVSHIWVVTIPIPHVSIC